MLESLKCEVIGVCWLSAYLSCVRWILCWLCLAFVRACIQLREDLCTPGYCIAQNPQWRFPVWESCVDKLVEVLLCEGGDVELCARTSKHIRVLAIDPLSLNSLSLYYFVHLFILPYHIHACVVCVCLTCV